MKTRLGETAGCDSRGECASERNRTKNPQSFKPVGDELLDDISRSTCFALPFPHMGNCGLSDHGNPCLFTVAFVAIDR